MKKLFSLCLSLVLTIFAYTQAPQKMSYQSVIRNTSGALVTNHSVGIRISILQGSATGAAVYVETHATTTNVNGLATIEIGGGTVVSGTFSAIDWGSGTYFLKTETDPSGGTAYTITGTSQLMSVPYALYSKTAANGFSGNYNDLTNKPVLFDGTWNSLTGKPAGFADGIDNVDDADNSITNEIQTLNLSGTTLSLSGGGGSVTLPSSGGGDNWGTQVVVTDASLAGNGTTASPLRIADNGVSSAKILDGAVSNADLADNSVTQAKIAAAAVTSDKLANLAVTTDKLGNNSVTIAKLPSGAAADKFLRGDGTWQIPSSGGLSLPFTGSAIPATGGSVISITDDTKGTAGDPATIGVRGISKAIEGIGVLGNAEATTGNATGIYGSTVSPTGSGVYGRAPVYAVRGVATNTSGSTYGIYGETASSSGYAVYGKATSTTGSNHGVLGVSNSASGKGVCGIALSPIGVNYGVYGESVSEHAAYGVYGIVSGIGSGVYGEGRWGGGSGVYGKIKADGYGVYGLGESDVASNWGVYGQSNSAYGGIGVEGRAEASTGQTIGIRGSAKSPEGIGVYGISPLIGVYGKSTNTDAAGVRGENTSSYGYGVLGSAPKFGVYGYSSGNQGRAVIGEADGTASIGVMGIATYTSSTGVWGEGALYDFYANGPGTNYGSASSIRWKTNISSIENPLHKVMAIRGVYFDWDEAHGGKHDIGMIAEEVGKVLPEIVVYEPNGIDASGMDYSKITPLLLEAIKEQQKQIEYQQKEIDELKALVKNLVVRK